MRWLFMAMLLLLAACAKPPPMVVTPPPSPLVEAYGRFKAFMESRVGELSHTEATVLWGKPDLIHEEPERSLATATWFSPGTCQMEGCDSSTAIMTDGHIWPIPSNLEIVFVDRRGVGVMQSYRVYHVKGKVLRTRAGVIHVTPTTGSMLTR